jgi:hypothetical protein
MLDEHAQKIYYVYDAFDDRSLKFNNILEIRNSVLDLLEYKIGSSIFNMDSFDLFMEFLNKYPAKNPFRIRLSLKGYIQVTWCEDIYNKFQIIFNPSRTLPYYRIYINIEDEINPIRMETSVVDYKNIIHAFGPVASIILEPQVVAKKRVRRSN